MSNQETKITYEIIQSQFSGFNIAEAHGMLTAIFCGDDPQSYERWLTELKKISIDDESINEEVLRILYDKTEAELRSEDFSLSLLIPGDEDFIGRVDGFIHWCSGFLYGFGIIGADISKLDEDGRQFLEYLAVFTQLDRDELKEGMSNNEEALALEELVEFVRMSALLIFYQLKEDKVVH